MSADKQVMNIPPPPQWLLDLTSEPIAKPKPGSILDPPGFPTLTSTSKKSAAAKTPARKPPTPDEMASLKLKKAWEVAIAPAKQLPMNAIGMYMTGNTLQIFSIFMVFTLFKAPITALMGIQTTFSRFESEQNRSKLLLVKLAFIASNMLALLLGVYKVDKMGLLPTTRSDWLAWESPRLPLERAVPFDTL